MREGTDDAVHASRTASPIPSQRSGLIVATAAAALLTVTEALGTGTVSLPVRLGYWLGVMLTGHFIGTGVTAAVWRWRRLAARPWLEAALIAVGISVPMTAVVLAASMLVFGIEAPGAGGLAYFYLMVLTITAALTALSYALGRPATARDLDDVRRAAAEAAPAAPPASSRPRLADRLPPPLRAAAIDALEAEDHYLRIHTAAGSELILMRITDAIAEMDGVEGARTHRSWWVRRGAIATVERSDGRAALTLASGLRAPVSRTYARDLAARGWFGPGG